MRVLIVGGGGREHALAWRIAQSSDVSAIACAPGNAGSLALGDNLPVAVNDIAAVTQAAVDFRADLVVIGPEEPLALGLADGLRLVGIPTFGPSAAAAQIESSKWWAKEVMLSAGIPTARAHVVDSMAAALKVVAAMSWPVVIKADGLAAGKGVVIAASQGHAEAVLRSFLEEGALGTAASKVLIEEFLSGQEVSVIALTDGETVQLLPPACDYKRAFDGDQGPNTGGMGAYAPVPFINADLLEQIRRQIMQPTIDAMARRGTPLCGALYAGLMLTSDGPRVLEYNARFGDPETQVIMPLIDGDFVGTLQAAATGHLSRVPPLAWKPGFAVGVVLASGGYPGQYSTGETISGIAPEGTGQMVFHASTRLNATADVVTAGGRVLTVVGEGASIAQARERAYAKVSDIHFEGMQYRTDIASRELPQAT